MAQDAGNNVHRQSLQAALPAMAKGFASLLHVITSFNAIRFIFYIVAQYNCFIKHDTNIFLHEMNNHDNLYFIQGGHNGLESFGSKNKASKAFP